MPRAGHLSFEDGRVALGPFLSWGLSMVGTDHLILDAFQVSERYGCSFYDALYVALAQSASRPLVYADKALRRRLEGAFPLALWIGNYTPVGS